MIWKGATNDIKEIGTLKYDEKNERRYGISSLVRFADKTGSNLRGGYRGLQS